MSKILNGMLFSWQYFFYFGNETVYEPVFKKDLRPEPWDLIGNYLRD
jgi:hypothetical protein